MQFHCRKSYKYDDVFSVGTAIILYYALFNGAVYSLVEYIAIDTSDYAKYFLVGAETLFILAGMFLAYQKKPIFVCGSFLLVVTLIFITFLFFPANTVVIQANFKALFFFCLPIMCFAYALDEYAHLWRLLDRYADIIVLSGAIYAFLTSEQYYYNMWLGYKLLLPMLVVMVRVFCQGLSLKSSISLLIAFITIFMKGSRGPLLVIIAFALMGIYLYYVKKSKNREQISHEILSFNLSGVVLLNAVSALIILSALNAEMISVILSDILQEYGYSVRLLKIVGSGGALLSGSGREDILHAVFQLLSESPWLGFGIGGDCVAISKTLYPAAYAVSTGLYAHNIFLEILLHYGIVIGGLFNFLFILSLSIIAIRINQFSPEGKLFFILLVFCCIQGILSGTYLSNTLFWLLLGLILKKVRI